MTEFVTYVTGDDEAQRLLREMRLRARDVREPLREFGEVVKADHAAVFAMQGRGGRRWKPLSPKYAAWKLKRVGPMPILQFTGELLKDLTTGLDERITRRSGTYGTNNKKAEWHEFGTSTPMPARPFFARSGDRVLQSELVRLVADHIMGDED